MTRSSLKNVLRLIDDAKNELPIEKSFLEDLKRSIELTDKTNSRQPSMTYKPSSMTCIRNMYYQVTGHMQDDGETSHILIDICNSGTDIHERIQGHVLNMKNNGMDCEYVNVADFVRSRNIQDLEIIKEPNFDSGEFETKLFHKGLNISFLCDGIIKYHGVYYILEIKTESIDKWMARKGVDPKHYAQGTAYSIMFNIPNVIFLYVNRNILDKKSFMFTPTDDMKQDLIGKITTCDSYVAQCVCPPKPVDVPRSSCDYCSYRTACNINAN